MNTVGQNPGQSGRRSGLEPAEERWFAEEILAHEPMLRAWLVSVFHLATDLDDIVQEAYLRVIRARANGPIFAGKAFLFATARNLAVSHFRRQVPGADASDLMTLIDAEPSAAEAVARHQELALLEQAIGALPTRCRTAFTLRKLEGLSQREIARHLGVAEHTVEAHVQQGTRRCIDFFASHGLPRDRERSGTLRFPPLAAEPEFALRQAG